MLSNNKQSVNFIKSQISSKSITLGNAHNQEEGLLNAHSIKRVSKRKRGQSLSNRKLKELGLADPSSNLNHEILNKLHESWWEYMILFMKGCKTSSQLQSRLGSIELVGAKVQVENGTHGIVTGATDKMLYITSTESSSKSSKDNKVIPVIRSEHKITIITLPPFHATQNINYECVLTPPLKKKEIININSIE